MKTLDAETSRRHPIVSLLSFLLIISLGLIFISPSLAQEKTTESPAAAPAEGEKPAAPAAEDKPTASVSLDGLSQYIWRGFALSRNFVLQPSVTVGYKGFSLNVWGNFDPREAYTPLTRRQAKWNETDVTLGYSKDVYNGEAIKAITLNLGGIYYAYDAAIYPQGDSLEFYFGGAIDVNWFKFTAAANKEFFHYPAWWLTLGISRVFELPWNKSTLELGNNFIFLFAQDKGAWPDHGDFTRTRAFNDPLAGQLYATLNIPVHKYVTVSPKVGFWYALGGKSTDMLRNLSWDFQQNHVYGGLNVTFAF
jgi:hypothetical protein